MNTSENKLNKDNYCNRKSFLRHIYEFNFKNIAKQFLFVVAKTFLRNENEAVCLMSLLEDHFTKDGKCRCAVTFCFSLEHPFHSSPPTSSHPSLYQFSTYSDTYSRWN